MKASESPSACEVTSRGRTSRDSAAGRGSFYLFCTAFALFSNLCLKASFKSRNAHFFPPFSVTDYGLSLGSLAPTSSFLADSLLAHGTFACGSDGGEACVMPFCAQQCLAIMLPRGDVLQPWVTGKQAHLSLFFSHTRLTYSTCRVQDTVPRMLGDGMRYQMWPMPQRFLHVGQRVKIYAEKIELAFKAIGFGVQMRFFNHNTVTSVLWGCPVLCRMLSDTPFSTHYMPVAFSPF